jgi:hypothetical protein
VVPFGSMNSLDPRPRRTSVSAPLGLDRQRIELLGSPKTWIGKPRCVPHREHPSKGAYTRVAGGRTSVSAPLDLDRKRIEPSGSQKTRIGNPMCAPPRTPSGQAMS